MSAWRSKIVRCRCNPNSIRCRYAPAPKVFNLKPADLFHSLVATLASSLVFAAADSGPNLQLDHPYTLRTSEAEPLEREYHRLAVGTGERSYIFPRACFSDLDSSSVCSNSAKLRYRDSTRSRSLAVVPVGGMEARFTEGGVGAFEAGLEAFGGTGPLSFYIDLRTFTELRDRPNLPSFDREFVESQDASASGSIGYSSYSRYRSNLAYDWDWGRLSVSRDAVHWGPGLYHNLAFNQEAVPFNQASFSSRIGPISVISLYGRLALDRNWQDDTTTDTRSLYAHRYEWRATRDLLLGISEQLILFNAEAPFALVPIVPLFIAKAYEKEMRNNGNIAIDASYRVPGLGQIYSEFFVDDLQSPTALFDDSWANKWAWMAGVHWAAGKDTFQRGAIVEYSRVEPWVYTHYKRRTAQTSNYDYPLGDQAGPNSQSLTGKAYLRMGSRWYVSLRGDLTWKGTDPGSSLDDENIAKKNLRKKFLGGSRGPTLAISPSASMDLRSGIMMGAWAEADGRGGVYLEYRY